MSIFRRNMVTDYLVTALAFLRKSLVLFIVPIIVFVGKMLNPFDFFILRTVYSLWSATR